MFMSICFKSGLVISFKGALSSLPARWEEAAHQNNGLEAGGGGGEAVGCTGYIIAECTTKRNVHGRLWVLEKLCFDIEDSETFVVVEKNATAGKDIPHLFE